MNDDVILSRAEAKNLADFLRRRGIGEHHSLLARLVTQSPSLRDEVASELGDTSWAGETAVRVLAVVRKRMKALDYARSRMSGDEWVRLDDVLDLLGGES